MPETIASATPAGLLGDTPQRDYCEKLQRFNAFAEPEIRQLMGTLGLRDGMRILDVGCGTGEALGWLSSAVEPTGTVFGIDLSAAHVAAARARAAKHIEILQCDLMSAPIPEGSFDLVWSANTINHLKDPVQGLLRLRRHVSAGGRVALAQSSLLPDMYFAWDARLERVTNDAVRRYYRERYGLEERELAAVRNLVGLLRRAGLNNVVARTVMIERTSPLDSASECYLREAIFRGTWGERLRPYLAAVDFDELARLCDPGHPHYALRRPDFHFLQTLTLATGEVS